MDSTAPISAIIPSRQRAASLRRTFESLAQQSCQPREVIIEDASDDDETKAVCAGGIAGLRSSIEWHRASIPGAAVQRNEAFARVTQPFVLFMDDDIVLEPECIARLWSALQGDSKLGGVNSMITNQSFHPPGGLGRYVLRLLGAATGGSPAGRWVGGVLNVLPADEPGLPEVVPVEWLNTTCTLYRREALPDPPFPDWFQGYSLGEDLALSLEVKRRGWSLANARTARIFHDTQPGDHKRSELKLAQMETVNRWRIGREYSGLSWGRLAFNLALLQWHKLLGGVASTSGLKKLPAQVAGNACGWWQIIRG